MSFYPAYITRFAIIWTDNVALCLHSVISSIYHNCLKSPFAPGVPASNKLLVFLIEKVDSSAGSEILKSPGVDLDFYLAHNMIRPSYDEKWRVYYPSNFE